MTRRAADVLREAVLRLRPVLGEGGARDARLLLAYALGIDAGRLTLVLQDDVAPEVLQSYLGYVDQRLSRQPASQIIGRRLFWGREFLVNCDVLDPRPETETLIELALRNAPPERILDLGLGSGCILLTLLAELPDAVGFGVDVSVAALRVAQKNAVRLGVADRTDVHQSDWFSAASGQFDLIVSNPPYITAAEMGELDPEVSHWEPKIALTPGPDGLESYRIIANSLDRFLAKDGRAFFEIGYRQGAAVCKIFQERGFDDVQVFPDLNGHDRVVQIRR